MVSTLRYRPQKKKRYGLVYRPRPIFSLLFCLERNFKHLITMSENPSSIVELTLNFVCVPAILRVNATHFKQKISDRKYRFHKIKKDIMID